MFIKLNFSSNKNLFQLFRVLTDIINTPSVTDVTSFYNRANSATYTAGMIGGFDPANSTIIRTQTTGGVGAHFSGQPTTTSSKFTLEMPVWDDPSKYIYIQYNNPSTTFTSYHLTVGTSQTGATTGSINVASQLVPSTADSYALYSGTSLSIGGYTSSYSAYTNYFVAGTGAASTASTTAIRTLWVYLSNTAFVWATNQSTTSTTGFSATANNITTGNAGPWIFSQTSRFDYWNRSNNSIYPMVYTHPRGDGFGFVANDFTVGVNTDYTFPYSTLTQGAMGYQQFCTINLPKINDPAAGFSGFYRTAAVGFPAPSIVSGPPVNAIIKLANQNSNSPIAIAGNYINANSQYGYTGFYQPQIGLNALSPNVITSIATAAGPEAYSHVPFGWNKHSWGAMGGSVSDVSKIFMFNGIYLPADEYTVNGLTYSIWPPYDGFVNKLGLAIPKQ